MGFKNKSIAGLFSQEFMKPINEEIEAMMIKELGNENVNNDIVNRYTEEILNNNPGIIPSKLRQELLKKPTQESTITKKGTIDGFNKLGNKEDNNQSPGYNLKKVDDNEYSSSNPNMSFKEWVDYNHGTGFYDTLINSANDKDQ